MATKRVRLIQRRKTVGYSQEPPRDLRSRRRPTDEVVHRGRWSDPAG